MECRVCNETKEKKDFTKRGHKLTQTCIDCSNERASKDYCEHGVRNHDCEECNDPIHRRILMILKTKSNDKKKGRNNDLTYENVKYLLLNCCDLCAYCGVDLQHKSKKYDNYSSIERINEDLGHIESNCIITCLDCNINRRGLYIWYKCLH